MLNRAVGEQRYDTLRVSRRILSNKFYYLRQHLLYRIFIESPDIGAMIGIYPKTDSTHGYGSNSTYFEIQFSMKCTETSRKTPLTVMAPSVCGLCIFVSFMLATHFIRISSRGTGIRLQAAKMANRKE